KEKFCFQNCMQFFAYMYSNQLGVMPNLHGYFAFLMDNNLVQLANFTNLLSWSVQASSSMLIALNRLLSIVRASQLKQNDSRFFTAGLHLFFHTAPTRLNPCLFQQCLLRSSPFSNWRDPLRAGGCKYEFNCSMRTLCAINGNHHKCHERSVSVSFD
ncbi:hypothetical protein PMAYCL1PPCAC_22219, partial [Pristionchus mayeri]